MTKARIWLDVLLASIAVVAYVMWHERHRWTFSATVVSGAITTGLGWVNSNAAALGVLATLVFGVLNYKAKQRIVAAAESGKLKLEDAEGE